MIDPAALREALADRPGVIDLSIVTAAAREFLRLMEKAETVWWCEEHECSGNPDACHRGTRFKSLFCRMVEAVLTRREPAQLEETELDRNQMGIW